MFFKENGQSSVDSEVSRLVLLLRGLALKTVHSPFSTKQVSPDDIIRVNFSTWQTPIFNQTLLLSYYWTSYLLICFGSPPLTAFLMGIIPSTFPEVWKNTIILLSWETAAFINWYTVKYIVHIHCHFSVAHCLSLGSHKHSGGHQMILSMTVFYIETYFEKRLQDRRQDKKTGKLGESYIRAESTRLLWLLWVCLTNQWSAVFYPDLLVSAQLTWNLNRGVLKKQDGMVLAPATSFASENSRITLLMSHKLN